MSGHSKWSSIKHKKGAADAKRGKLFTKLARSIIVAAKEGGGDPSGNSSLQNAIETVESGNVIGKLPGSDPKLAGEAVLYTAHHDHFGIKEGATPGADAIYNGARDNASGVAAMLAVARAFTRLPKPPRRSILFASVTSEEQGSLGSAYLAKHPPVPAGDFAANINIDKTPPAIRGATNPPPNAAGWNNSNVTASFTCSDALSATRPSAGFF